RFSRDWSSDVCSSDLSGANPERSRHCNRHRQGTAATALLRGKAVVEIPPEARKPACVRGNVHAFGSKVRMELCGGRLSLQPAFSTCPCVGRFFCGRDRKSTRLNSSHV